LMNELVGERISIITNKSQTTRHRIMGIVNTDDYQIVFSDTPGVLKPLYKLQESMRKFSESALVDADVMLYITDIYETPDKNEDFLQKVAKLSSPILLIINKIDLTNQEKLTTIVQTWEQRLPHAEIIPCSALTKFNVQYILKRIVELLPIGPPYYDKDALTDKPLRFFVSEIIREKILLYYQKEIPYSTEVVIEEYKEEPTRDIIRAVILVNRDSQRGIVIGNKGAAIKKLGIESRLEIEKFVQKKVHLELFVKVSKDWRDNESLLKQFGYNIL